MKKSIKFLSIVLAGLMIFFTSIITTACGANTENIMPDETLSNDEEDKEDDIFQTSEDESKDGILSTVKNIVSVASSEKVIFTWDQPDYENYGGVLITIFSENEDNPMPVFATSEQTSITIEGLNEQTEYKFIFTVCDKDGNETNFIKHFTFTTPKETVIEIIKEVEVEVIKEVEIVKEVEITTGNENQSTDENNDSEEETNGDNGDTGSSTDSEEKPQITPPDIDIPDIDIIIQYNTGDIIYSDGSYSTPANYNSSKKAVAVVFFDSDGNALGLGINKITQQKWAEADTTGLNTNFGEIQSYYDANEAIIYGDLDGSDNWDEISLADEDGAKNQSVNYPGFSLVNSYAENNNLTGTDFESGWYAPSLFELYAIYSNLEQINTTLEKIPKSNILSTSEKGYWSSSQNPEIDINAWYIRFDTGEIKSAKKTTGRGFRVIRKLQ